jgi:hypothetical protein
MANPNLYPAMPSGPMVQAQQQQVQQQFAQNFPQVAPSSVPYMSPANLQMIAELINAPKNDPRYQAMIAAIPTMAQGADQRANEELIRRQQEINTRKDVEQQFAAQHEFPAAPPETPPPVSVWDTGEEPPPLYGGDPDEVLTPIYTDAEPQLHPPQLSERLQQDIAQLSDDQVVAMYQQTEAYAHQITGDQTIDEWTKDDEQLQQQIVAMSGQYQEVREARENGTAPEFYTVDLPDGEKVDVPAEDYEALLLDQVEGAQQVAQIREEVKTLSFYGEPLQDTESMTQVLMNLVVLPFVAFGDFSNYGFEHIGRPLFGWMYYNMARLGQAFAGPHTPEGSEDLAIIQTYQDEGPAAVWEKHIAARADEAPGITSYLAHGLINMVADPLTYVSLGTGFFARRAAQAGAKVAAASTASRVLESGIDDAAAAAIRSIAKPGSLTDEISDAINAGIAISPDQAAYLRQTSGLSDEVIGLISGGVDPADLPTMLNQAITGGRKLADLERARDMTDLMGRAGQGVKALDYATSAPGIAIWRGAQGMGKAITAATEGVLGSRSPFLPDPDQAIRRADQALNVAAATDFYKPGNVDMTRASMVADQPELAAVAIDLSTPSMRREVLGNLPAEARYQLVIDSPEVVDALKVGNRKIIKVTPEARIQSDLAENEIVLAELRSPTTRAPAGATPPPATPVEVDPLTFGKHSYFRNQQGSVATVEGESSYAVTKGTSTGKKTDPVWNVDFVEPGTAGSTGLGGTRLADGVTFDDGVRIANEHNATRLQPEVPPTPRPGSRVKSGNKQRIVYNTITDEVHIEELTPRIKVAGKIQSPATWKRGPTISASTLDADQKIGGWLGEEPLRQAVRQELPGMTPELAKRAGRDLLQDWTNRLSRMTAEAEAITPEKAERGIIGRLRPEKTPGPGDAPTTGLTGEAEQFIPTGYTVLGRNKEKGLAVWQNDVDSSVSINQYMGDGVWKNLKTLSLDDIAGARPLGAADTDRLYTGTGVTPNNFVSELRTKSPDAYVNVHNQVKDTIGRRLMVYGEGPAEAEHEIFELLYSSEIIKAARSHLGAGETLPNWVLRMTKPIGGKTKGTLETVSKFLEEAAFRGKPATPDNLTKAIPTVIGSPKQWTDMSAQDFMKSAPELHEEALVAHKAIDKANLGAKQLTPAKAAKALKISEEDLWERWVREFDPNKLAIDEGADLRAIGKGVKRRVYDRARLQIAEGLLGRDLTSTEIGQLSRMEELPGVSRFAVDAPPTPAPGTPERIAADEASQKVAAEQLLAQQARLQQRRLPSNEEVGAALEPVENITVPSGEGRDSRFAKSILGVPQNESLTPMSAVRGVTTNPEDSLGQAPLSNLSVAPQSTSDFAFHMYKIGQAAPDVYQFMTRDAPDGRKVWQIYLDVFDRGGSDQASQDAAVDAVAKALDIGAGQHRSMVGKGWDATTGVYRDAAMYNIASGTVKGTVDMATDMFTMAATGHGDVALASATQFWRNSKAFTMARFSRNPEVRARAKVAMVEPMVDSNEAWLAAGNPMREQYGHMHALRVDEPLPAEGDFAEAMRNLNIESSELFVTAPERGLEALGRKIGGGKGGKFLRTVGSVAISNSTMRTWRVMIDDTKRSLLYKMEFVRFHPEAVDELIVRARRVAPQLGMSEVQIEDTIRRLRVTGLSDKHQAIMDEFFPGYHNFTSDQLSEALGGKGAALDLARFWKGQQRRVQVRAEKSVDEIMFSYMPTKLDTKLQKVIFFHYWTSRALALQAKIYFENPLVASNFTRLFEGLKRETDRNPERPWYLKYTAEVMNSPYGMTAMFSPISMIVPLSIAMDFSGMLENNDNAYEKISQFAFIHPFLQTAASIYGLTDQVPDVTATGAFRRKTIALANILKASGHWPDVMPGGGSYDITDDAIADNVMQLINFSRSLAGEAAVGRPNRAEYDRRRIRHYMVEVIREQGKDPLSPEFDLLWSEWSEGTNGSDIYKEAYQRFAADQLLGEGLRSVVPITTTFEPQDETNYLAGQVSDITEAGGVPTQEMLDARDIQGLGNAPPGDASRLEVLLRQKERIGDEAIKETYTHYTNFAYDDLEELQEEYGPGARVYMPDQTYSLEEWSAFPDAQRQLYLDEWVDSIGETRKLHAYKMALSALETQEPLIAGYNSYMQWVGQQKSPEIAAELLADASPSFRAYLAQQSGDYDLGSLMFSPDAYLAQKGIEGTIYENLPAQAFDTSAISAVEGLTGGTGGGQEQQFFSKSWDEMTTDEKVTSLTKDIRDFTLEQQRWDDAVAQVLPPGTDASWWGQPGGGGWFDMTIGPQLQAAGFSPPSIPKWVENYYRWMPMAAGLGLEITPQSYVQWWEKQFGVSPLSAPQSSAPELQYAGT